MLLFFSQHFRLDDVFTQLEGAGDRIAAAIQEEAARKAAEINEQDKL